MLRGAERHRAGSTHRSASITRAQEDTQTHKTYTIQYTHTLSVQNYCCFVTQLDSDHDVLAQRLECNVTHRFLRRGFKASSVGLLLHSIFLNYKSEPVIKHPYLDNVLDCGWSWAGRNKWQPYQHWDWKACWEVNFAFVFLPLFGKMFLSVIVCSFGLMCSGFELSYSITIRWNVCLFYFDSTETVHLKGNIPFATNVNCTLGNLQNTIWTIFAGSILLQTYGSPCEDCQVLCINQKVMCVQLFSVISLDTSLLLCFW